MWSLHLHANNKWVHLLYNNRSGPERRQCHLCITESSIFIANCLNRHILRLSAIIWVCHVITYFKLKTLWHCKYFNLISLSFIRDILTYTMKGCKFCESSLACLPHLLWHRAFVYNGHRRGPVTLTPITPMSVCH